MPVVTVQLYEGRTVDQKRALVEAITKAMVDIAKTPASSVHIIFQDVPRSNWGTEGKLASEM